jgi:hypothetical protein
MRSARQHYVGGELDSGRQSHWAVLHTPAAMGEAAKLSNAANVTHRGKPPTTQAEGWRCRRTPNLQPAGKAHQQSDASPKAGSLVVRTTFATTTLKLSRVHRQLFSPFLIHLSLCSVDVRY